MPRTYRHRQSAGKVLSSGGFGCVFYPELRCKNGLDATTSSGTRRRRISKLMTVKHAKSEFRQIQVVASLLKDIPNASDYFLLFDVSLCEPAPLTMSDLENWKKCSALEKDKITQHNINTQLHQLRSLNEPFGGKPIDDYFHEQQSGQVFMTYNDALMRLWTHGIRRMNDRHVYHNDIKTSNILMDESGRYARLIDWGLVVHYDALVHKIRSMPRMWYNRPLQFNVPFTSILFTDKFVREWPTFAQSDWRTFVWRYMQKWVMGRSSRHYSYLVVVACMAFFERSSSSSRGALDPSRRQQLVVSSEKRLIRAMFVSLVGVLDKYVVGVNGNDLNGLTRYLNTVYIHWIDMWGFLMGYVPMLEVLFINSDQLNDTQWAAFEKLQSIYRYYLFEPHIERAPSADALERHLAELGDILATTEMKTLRPSMSWSHFLRSVNVSQMLEVSEPNLLLGKLD